MTSEAIRNSILLHSCCGPCSTAVIKRLLESFDVTVFFYNPNITDDAEYRLREKEQRRFIDLFSRAESLNAACTAEPHSCHSARLSYVEGDYNPSEYYMAVKGFEQEPEGGARCAICERLRMEQTARLAKEKGFDFFDTTLTVSPHKNFDVISAIGNDLAETYGIRYLGGNYKKQDGFGESVRMSKEYGLYRQSYCGCSFSERPVSR